MKINVITSAALEDGASETDLFTVRFCLLKRQYLGQRAVRFPEYHT